MLLGVVGYAWTNRREPWGVPAMAICGTVFAWYHCDALYNDYAAYTARFPAEAAEAAWWQVSGFLICFAALAPALYGQFNRRVGRRASRVYALAARNDSLTGIRRLVPRLLALAAGAWLVVIVIALVRTNFDVIGLFLPWLDHLAQPWARNRIGTPIDFVVSLMSYLTIFCLACFGIVAALSEETPLTAASLVLVALSWPAVFLDRTRNTMLAVLVPGLLCLVFIRLRRRAVAQVATLVCTFLALSIWFSFVVAHRAEETIVHALNTSSVEDTMDAKHEGLNMFEELCWINALMADGRYRPNWGERYFGDLVNFVPRSLWPGKPLIGFDYAIARGMGTDKTSDGIYASIATGMIGQGVVNFGAWGGPLAAALLVSLWVAALARFDLDADRFGRLPLYVFGLALTFNLGRDVTLLTIYPLLFGYVMIHIIESTEKRRQHALKHGASGSQRLSEKPPSPAGRRRPHENGGAAKSGGIGPINPKRGPLPRPHPGPLPEGEGLDLQPSVQPLPEGEGS